MFDRWITISVRWDLVDVQAYLSVVISILSTFSIFVLAHAFWHLAAARIPAPIPSLFTLTTIGEAFDAVVLLKANLFTSRHVSLLVRCLIVVIFSVTNIVSGPIARYSTRRGTIVEASDVNGTLAIRGDNCLSNMGVDWSTRISDLDRAKFPLDQLLDFAPSLTSNWLYNPLEWNSSFSADCKFQNETDVDLYTTGDYGDIYTEVPGLYDLVPDRFLTEYYSEEIQTSGNRWTDGDKVWIWKDTMVFLVHTLLPPSFSFDKGGPFMSISITAVHLQDAQWTPNYTLHNFGAGAVPSSRYTRATCDLRSVPRDPTDWYRAYPDVTWDGACFASSMVSYYMGNFSKMSMSDQPISLPSGRDIFRFYQAYTLVKDTAFPNPITRTMSTEIPSIELSIILVISGALVLLLLALGGILWAVQRLRYNKMYTLVPSSKLDWMLHAVREARENKDAEAQTAVRPTPKDAMETGCRHQFEGSVLGVWNGKARICVEELLDTNQSHDELALSRVKSLVHAY